MRSVLSVGVWSDRQEVSGCFPCCPSGCRHYPQVLPAILAYPTISLMTLAIRSPGSFYPQASSSSSSPSSSQSTSTPNAGKSRDSKQDGLQADVRARLPRLDELRLFTAGSDSGDLVERCLSTGRVLVSLLESRLRVDGDGN